MTFNRRAPWAVFKYWAHGCIVVLRVRTRGCERLQDETGLPYESERVQVTNTPHESELGCSVAAVVGTLWSQAGAWHLPTLSWVPERTKSFSVGSDSVVGRGVFFNACQGVSHSFNVTVNTVLLNLAEPCRPFFFFEYTHRFSTLQTASSNLWVKVDSGPSVALCPAFSRLVRADKLGNHFDLANVHVDALGEAPNLKLGRLRSSRTRVSRG